MALVRLDLLCDVSGIVVHPADERRAASPLPVQAQKVKAWNVGHAASMAYSAVRLEHG